MADKEEAKPAPVTIKKYANRRLYNTATSSYVTLDHLCQMVKDGTDFVVYDAKTGDDITRSVLTQIIVEEESKGQNLLPIPFLRQLISFYGDNMQWLVPRYLEHSMKSFTGNQDKMREYFQTTFGSIFPFGGFEEMSKQNIALFERAMRMFSPFNGEGGAMDASGTPMAATGDAPKPKADDKFSELQKRLDELQSQMESLTRRKE
ncbi:polyhydroxyalkanoate synthesis repressor PhaR [Niveispirillum sp. SYP-B3756]|uniref:polyhydroxyalkanoate synthesis repressor PhaR n=1 Tax=Niveispirillum sp. SYP-B3756 TaxID=2662178 RepID=UPI0012928EA9|nr:polyhydroxyalkanoate synthesis repressor PhaR [Niveispirillum sp. SYP-B3756]MQP66054.1 polyhydroxyalkanoate synthesis repressor PhaR [Niveispirillum sp. SYP-B3756]